MTLKAIHIFYVASGGMIGAVLRYLMSLAAQSASISFPYGTLASNLIGCFVIGLVTQIAADSEILSTEARLFLATGICGGFTTLSSMVYELVQLMRDNEALLAAAYFATTFFGALICFYLGSLLVNLTLRA